MGCDIHCYKEKQVNGKWLTADNWEYYDYGEDDKGKEVPWKERFTGRNYQLFGMLARGVRGEHPFSFEPRGLPFNPCAEIASEAERWVGDGHSHSYLYLHELKDMLAYLQTVEIRVTGMKDKAELQALRDSIASGNPDWQLLFPYCSWTNGPESEEFQLDVPASFYMGDDLKRIIDSFEGIDGDNHRIVFFFDN